MNKVISIAALLLLLAAPASAIECRTIGGGQFVGPGWQQCAETQRTYDQMERERRDMEIRMHQMERNREDDRYNMEMRQAATPTPI